MRIFLPYYSPSQIRKNRKKSEKASKKYTDNPVALHLRGMNMLFEGLKEKGSMVIVPSSALDTMNLGAMGGLVSLAKNNETPK